MDGLLIVVARSHGHSEFLFFPLCLIPRDFFVATELAESSLAVAHKHPDTSVMAHSTAVVNPVHRPVFFNCHKKGAFSKSRSVDDIDFKQEWPKLVCIHGGRIKDQWKSSSTLSSTQRAALSDGQRFSACCQFQFNSNSSTI